MRTNDYANIAIKLGWTNQTEWIPIYLMGYFYSNSTSALTYLSSIVSILSEGNMVQAGVAAGNAIKAIASNIQITGTQYYTVSTLLSATMYALDWPVYQCVPNASAIYVIDFFTGLASVA